MKAKIKISESQLPYTVGTYNHALQLQLKHQSRQGAEAFQAVKEVLQSHNIEVSERVVKSLAQGQTFEVIFALYREQAEEQSKNETNKFLRAGTLKVAEDEAEELAKTLQGTNLLRDAKWCAPILDHIDYENMTFDPDAFLRATDYLHSNVVTTVGGLAALNDHLRIIEELNAFSAKLTEGVAAGCIYDSNVGQFRPSHVDYDEAAGR